MVEVETSEEWRTVEDFPHYEVSSIGRVRSIDRVVHKRGQGPASLRGRHLVLIVQPRKTCFYAMVNLRDGTSGRVCYVHRLVCTAFHGRPPFPKAHVNHKNGDGTDNRVENLEWVTCSENALHARRVLGRKTVNKSGADHGNAIRVDVQEARALRAQGMGYRQIGVHLGVSTGTACNVLKGRHWSQR
jgi:hypothetical protein